MIGTINMSGALRNMSGAFRSLTESVKPLMANAKDFALRYWRVIGLLVLLAVVLAGYALWPRTTATTTASTPGWSRQCVAGVSYLQFASGVSVEWTPAGKVRTCSESAK